jgi:hypothetical protein
MRFEGYAKTNREGNQTNEKGENMAKRVTVVPFILLIVGSVSLLNVSNGQTKKLPVSELSSGFMMEVPPDQSTITIVANLVNRLAANGFTCLPLRDLTLTYTHAHMCQIRKSSYDEHIQIGRVEGVGDRSAKVYGRIGVRFTLVFKEKVDLSLFPAELDNLVDMIGGTFQREKKGTDEKEAAPKKESPEKAGGDQLTGSALQGEKKDPDEKESAAKKGNAEKSGGSQ